jgi:hypothetical protein
MRGSRPRRCRRARRAFSSPSKFREMAGSEIGNGRASSLPRVSPSRARGSSMHCRVGSARARKIAVILECPVTNAWIYILSPPTKIQAPQHRLEPVSWVSPSARPPTRRKKRKTHTLLPRARPSRLRLILLLLLGPQGLRRIRRSRSSRRYEPCQGRSHPQGQYTCPHYAEIHSLHFK